MKAFKVSIKTQEDVAEIQEFIAQFNESAAARFTDDVFARFELLAENPFLGEVRSELQPGIR